VDKIAAPLKQYGFHRGATHIAYVINAVLIPRLAYLLKDSSAWGTRAGKAMVQNLDKHVRKVFKQCCSISVKTSNAQIYTPSCKGGYGLLSLRDVVDRAIIERWRCLQLCPRMAYWDRMTMSEDAAVRAEGVRRQHLVGAPHVTAQPIREIGRTDSKDEGGGAWGAGASAAVAGRARALWSALARHKMTLEDSAKLARGRGQWMMTALGDMGEELAPTLAALDLLWVGDVATKDGLRIRSYRELQWAGVTRTGKDTKNGMR